MRVNNPYFSSKPQKSTFRPSNLFFPDDAKFFKICSVNADKNVMQHCNYKAIG